jgi:hypothetical protein
MSAVGIAAIALGVFVVGARAPLMLVPGAVLRWFEGLLETNTRIRIMGAMFPIPGAAMIWAGATQDTFLAGVLVVVGWWIAGASTLFLLIFPNAYRALGMALLPGRQEVDDSLLGWRLVGAFGTWIGSMLIYYGVLAL